MRRNVFSVIPRAMKGKVKRILFEEVGLIGNAFILLASLIILVIASDVTINNSVKLSNITGFGKTTVGFILVGFATSLPELSVAIFGVRSGSIGVSIGNVLGSNIVDISLVLGVCFLIVAVKCPRFQCIYPAMAKEEIGNLYFGLFIASIIPLALLYIGYASQLIGVLLLFIFLFYMVQLARVKREKQEVTLGDDRGRFRRYILLALIGAAVVVASGFFIVDSASFMAASVGVPPVIIGATIVAFGTSIPELATSVSSVRKGHFDLALGNIVGSCFINITCILGVALIASPLSVNIAAFSNLALFSLITNLFLWYFLSIEKMSWREGTLLLVLYSAFIVISFGGYRA
jgi:cation:H+ antiporter